ncbi:MAG: PEGA domain-containing protein [Thermoguttaceae bacterium]|nr:PEGA domain-containing protein [Thermoguttaceae bacterium]
MGTYLFVRTQPAGAEVFVDGESVGKTNLLVPVVPGRHQLRIELAGYAPVKVTVNCPPERVTRVETTLQAAAEQPGPAPTVRPPQVPPAEEIPRVRVERLIAEAVALYEQGDIGEAMETLGAARKVAETVSEESTRDWVIGEVAKGYAQIMDHAGAIETALMIRRLSR